MDRRSFLLGTVVTCVSGPALSDGMLPSQNATSSTCRNRLRDSLRLGELSSARLHAARAVIDDEDFFTEHVNPALLTATSAVAQNPTDQRASAHLIGLLNTINASRYATKVSSNPTANLMHTDHMLLMAYAVLALDETSFLTKDDRKALLKPINKRATLSTYKKKFYYGMKDCTGATRGKPDRDPFGCQNHTYGVQHLRMVMGVLNNRKSEIRRGEKLYKYAIDDLSPDGALWREAVRGAYSWTYYPHALSHLVAIADLDARLGGSLWDYVSRRGQSIHDPVRFYTNSLADPSNANLMRKHSVRNLGTEGRQYGDTPFATGRHKRALQFQHYQAWFPVYRSRFPDRAETKAFARLVRRSSSTNFSYHLGLDTWCIFG